MGKAMFVTDNRRFLIHTKNRSATKVRRRGRIKFLRKNRTLNGSSLHNIQGLIIRYNTSRLIHLNVSNTNQVIRGRGLQLLRRHANSTRTLTLSAKRVNTTLLSMHIMLVKRFLGRSVNLHRLHNVTGLLVNNIQIAPPRIFNGDTKRRRILLRRRNRLVTRHLGIVITRIRTTSLRQTETRIMRSQRRLCREQLYQADATSSTSNRTEAGLRISIIGRKLFKAIKMTRNSIIRFSKTINRIDRQIDQILRHTFLLRRLTSALNEDLEGGRRSRGRKRRRRNRGGLRNVNSRQDRLTNKRTRHHVVTKDSSLPHTRPYSRGRQNMSTRRRSQRIRTRSTFNLNRILRSTLKSTTRLKSLRKFTIVKLSRTSTLRILISRIIRHVMNIGRTLRRKIRRRSRATRTSNRGQSTNRRRRKGQQKSARQRRPNCSRRSQNARTRAGSRRMNILRIHRINNRSNRSQANKRPISINRTRTLRLLRLILTRILNRTHTNRNHMLSKRRTNARQGRHTRRRGRTRLSNNQRTTANSALVSRQDRSNQGRSFRGAFSHRRRQDRSTNFLMFAGQVTRHTRCVFKLIQFSNFTHLHSYLYNVTRSFSSFISTASTPS